MSIRSLLPSVQPEERASLLYAVVAFMSVAAAGVVARTAGSAMFLSQHPASSLAPMYVASALILMAASFGFGWLVSKTSLVRVIVTTSVILVLTTLVLRGTTTLSLWGSSAAVYLFSDLVAKLPAMMFWAFAATIFNPRQAKRLFVLVGAGGTLSCVIAGALIGPFAKLVGLENLLFPVAVLLAGFGVTIWRWVGIQETQEMGPRRFVRASGGIRYYRELLALPQVRNLAALAVVSAGTLLLTDYLFKSAARAHYVSADLAAFFGLFYSASSLTALVFQIFLVHSILRRGGVVLAASILPGSLLVMSTGIALTGGFGWVIAAKFVDPVFDFTVSAAAMQLLYLGIRKQSRSQGRAFIDGLAKPVATTLAGIFLITVAASIEPRKIAVLIAIGSAVWLVAAWKSCRSYVAGLLESIGVHHFDPSDEAFAFEDPIVETHVREALLTASDEEVLYLLGIADQMDQVDLRAEFRELLSRETPEIKIAALEYLGEHGTTYDLAWVCEALENENPEVRTAGIHSLAALAQGDALHEIEQYLEDPSPEVRAAATTELINVGDLEGLLAACINLKEMLRSDDERARAAAARALARVTHTGLTKVLANLLEDPDSTVRKAALRACTERPDSHLIPSVLKLLSDPDLAIVASDTLAAFGPAVISYLDSFPEDARHSPPDDLMLIPSVLAQTREVTAMALLERALDVPNVRLRSRVVAAYCELVESLPLAQRPREVLETAALREISTSQLRAATIETLQGHGDANLLAHVLEEERLDLLSNAFTLIGALNPKVNIRSILWVLRSGTPEKRAEALEILDNVLDGHLKSAIFAIFEPSSKTSGTGEDKDLPVERLLSEDNSEWVVASAAYTTGRHLVVSSLGSIRELLLNESPYVREAALDAFSRLATSEEVRFAAELVIDDPSIMVRKVAKRLLAEVPLDHA